MKRIILRGLLLIVTAVVVASFIVVLLFAFVNDIPAMNYPPF